jgi:hypothetical protein
MRHRFKAQRYNVLTDHEQETLPHVHGGVESCASTPQVIYVKFDICVKSRCGWLFKDCHPQRGKRHIHTIDTAPGMQGLKAMVDGNSLVTS